VRECRVIWESPRYPKLVPKNQYERDEAAMCLLCGSTENLTDEHIIPAALGGDDVVPNGSCSKCNGTSSREFEAEFTNGLKHVCHILGVENRTGRVPSIAGVTVINGTKLNIVLQPGGKFQFQEKKEERILDTGKKVTDYFLFSDAKVKQIQERLTRRGERLEITEPDGRPIEFEPQSSMPLDFIGEQCALRTATKVAYFAIAKVAGSKFAELDAFSDTRNYLLTGDGSPAQLFVNQNFAANVAVGPHQHAVQVYCDGGGEQSVFAIVTLFGGLTYLVQLSSIYRGADYGFTYGYDARQRKETTVLVGDLDTERLAILDVRFGDTTYQNVAVMAEHWAKYIQSVATEQINPVERRMPSTEL
jgi:hypothetical protein